MPLLHHLNLSNNRILDVYVYHFNPVGTVNTNAFNEFMDRIPSTNIEILDISHNYLGGIPALINNRLIWQNEALYDKYQYDNIVIPIISTMLRSTNTLKSLKLHSNDIDDNEEWALMLLDAIGTKNINLLDGIINVTANSSSGSRLVAQNISTFNARLIGHHISNKPIEALDFSFNPNMDDIALSSIFQSFNNTKQLHLKELTLHNTTITAEGVRKLCALIQHKVLSIDKLDISNNGNMDDVAIKIIANHLKSDNTMKSLSIANCQVTTIGARLVADALGVNRSLTALDISGNDIQVSGLKCILDVLPANGTITSFIAAHNSIDDGIQSLRTPAAWGLNKTRLTYFSAARNPICGRRSTQTFEPAAIIALAECLEKANCKIETLVLSHCDIGARSTKRLLEMLQVNLTLHTLEINECNINEQGGIHVGELLPEVVGLKILLMNNCLIGPYGAERLLLGLADNTSIEHIDISYNYLMGYNNNEYLLNSLLALQSVTKKNKTLKYMDMTGNNLFGLSPIATETEEFKTEGVMTLVEALGCCSHPIVFNIMDRMKPRIESARATADSNLCCASSAAVNMFIMILNSNANVRSLCGMRSTDTVMNLSSRYVDEYCIRIIAIELARNQRIHTLKANNYNLNESCIYWLNLAISQSVSLNAVEYPTTLRRDIPFTPFQKMVNYLRRDENVRLSHNIYLAKSASLDLRLTLCLFSKKFSRKKLPVRVIFEFLLGEVEAIHVLVTRWCRI